MKACFILAALCGMLLATTAMSFDDDEDMDEFTGLSHDPSAMAWRGSCRGCGWGKNDNMMEEPLTADEIQDMMEMLDPQGGRRNRGREYRRGDRGGKGGRGNDVRGGYNTEDDIFEDPATTIGEEMTQDPILGLGFGWGGWGRPWGGWGRGWGGWGRRWGWGGRRWGGWGRRFFDSDDSQEMQEEPETITADDLEDMMQEPQGGRFRGGGGRYRGGRDRYRGGRDRYRGGRDRYRGGRRGGN